MQKVCAGLTDAKKLKSSPTARRRARSVARIAQAELAKDGIVYMDVPVSGGMAGARDGTLAVMVSGQRAVYDRIEPAHQAIRQAVLLRRRRGSRAGHEAREQHHRGRRDRDVGRGHRDGHEGRPEPAADVRHHQRRQRPQRATQDKFPRSVLPGTFDFGFATGLSYKDVRLCLQEADAQGVPMPVGAEVFQVLGITKARFGADSDFTCIAKVYEEWAGVEMRG